jgi:3-methyladenine DNA glycosylase/8-oxoguanine DNA glycosylase
MGDATGDRTARFEVDGLAVAATLRPLGVYPGDPTHRWEANSFTKAVLTPQGPGSCRLTWSADGATDRSADRSAGRSIDVAAWGPGTDWLIEQAPRWLGLHDDLRGFDHTTHPLVNDLWRRHGPIRLAAAGVVWQELLFVILGQRVTSEEAVRSWRRMVDTWGEPAPGPGDLRTPPRPDVIAARSYVDLHRMNIERRRADAILLAAKRANRLEEAASMPAADALVRLSALPGHGLWTATSTVTVSHGDPDTIVLRDYGLPTLVNYAFSGSATRVAPDAGGDELMCRHLAPWTGHRQRIVRLLYTAGITPPRRGPRAANPDIRRL